MKAGMKGGTALGTLASQSRSPLFLQAAGETPPGWPPFHPAVSAPVRVIVLRSRCSFAVAGRREARTALSAGAGSWRFTVQIRPIVVPGCRAVVADYLPKPNREGPMKAIRVHQVGGPDVMQLEDIPEPTPGAGEVLVRVEAIGINFIEVYQRTGQYPMKFPFTPGREAAGTVVAVGPDV